MLIPPDSGIRSGLQEAANEGVKFAADLLDILQRSDAGEDVDEIAAARLINFASTIDKDLPSRLLESKLQLIADDLGTIEYGFGRLFRPIYDALFPPVASSFPRPKREPDFRMPELRRCKMTTARGPCRMPRTHPRDLCSNHFRTFHGHQFIYHHEIDGGPNAGDHICECGRGYHWGTKTAVIRQINQEFCPLKKKAKP